MTRWTCPSCRAPFQTDFAYCPVDGARLVEAAEDPLIGRVLAGRYRVLAAHSSGGSGQVYRAEHVGTARAIAIKVLWGEETGSERARARFRREATSASRLSHPNIVEVIDFVEEGAFVFLALGWVDGPDLGRRVDRGGALEEREVARVGREVALALGHAHEHGVLHRDLKPDNILLEPEGRVRVVDFGLAMALDEAGPRLTEHGMLVGTPAFVSPEQIGGDPLGPPSDLYGLGAVLWFALVGRPPFEGSAMAILQRVLGEAAPPVRTRSPRRIGAPMATLVDRLLERDPSVRPRTASEVAERLAAIERSPSAPSSGGERPTTADDGPPRPPPDAQERQAAPGSDPSSDEAASGLMSAAGVGTGPRSGPLSAPPQGTDFAAPVSVDLGPAPEDDGPEPEALPADAIEPLPEAERPSMVDVRAALRPSRTRWIAPLLLVALVGAALLALRSVDGLLLAPGTEDRSVAGPAGGPPETEAASPREPTSLGARSAEPVQGPRAEAPATGGALGPGAGAERAPTHAEQAPSSEAATGAEQIPRSEAATGAEQIPRREAPTGAEQAPRSEATMGRAARPPLDRPRRRRRPRREAATEPAPAPAPVLDAGALVRRHASVGQRIGQVQDEQRRAALKQRFLALPLQRALRDAQVRGRMTSALETLDDELDRLLR